MDEVKAAVRGPRCGVRSVSVSQTVVRHAGFAPVWGWTLHSAKFTSETSRKGRLHIYSVTVKPFLIANPSLVSLTGRKQRRGEKQQPLSVHFICKGRFPKTCLHLSDWLICACGSTTHCVSSLGWTQRGLCGIIRGLRRNRLAESGAGCFQSVEDERTGKIPQM